MNFWTYLLLKKRWLLVLVGLLVFTYLFDWLFHGVIMNEAYENTSDLWRPAATMKGYIPYLVLVELVQLGIIMYLYMRMKPNNGVLYGLMMGLFIGMGLFSSYATMPIPMSMAVAWVVGYLIYGGILGYALGRFLHPKDRLGTIGGF